MKVTEQVIRHYTLTEGDFRVQLTIADNDSVRLQTYKGDREFVFENQYHEEILERWNAVLKLMQKAVKIAREKLDT